MRTNSNQKIGFSFRFAVSFVIVSGQQSFLWRPSFKTSWFEKQRSTLSNLHIRNGSNANPGKKAAPMFKRQVSRKRCLQTMGPSAIKVFNPGGCPETCRKQVVRHMTSRRSRNMPRPSGSPHDFSQTTPRIKKFDFRGARFQSKTCASFSKIHQIDLNRVWALSHNTFYCAKLVAKSAAAVFQYG